MSAQITDQGVELPTWTDPTSVAAYLTTLISAVVGVLTLAHPGFTEPAVVPALVPAVSLLVAGAAIIVNIVRHTKGTVAAIAANTSVKAKPKS